MEKHVGRCKVVRGIVTPPNIRYVTRKMDQNRITLREQVVAEGEREEGGES